VNVADPTANTRLMDAFTRITPSRAVSKFAEVDILATRAASPHG
jgi:hypothetical protein